MLHRRPHETISHEANQALEIEGWRPSFRRRKHEIVSWPGNFLIEVINLNGEEVIGGISAFGVENSLALSEAEGCEGLGYGVCDTAENLERRGGLERACSGDWWISRR